MPPQPLPSHANVDGLEGLAEVLRELVLAGDPDSIAMVRQHHPRADVGDFTSDDARLTVARHHGFAGWPELERRLALIDELARSPHLQEVGAEGADPADDLLRLGCLAYGTADPSRPDRARELLDSQPALAEHSVFTLAATGRAADLEELLVRSPGAVNTSGGPFDWPPLLYAAYGRIPGVDTLAAGEVLLEAGADPEAGFLWEGLIPPFTALTGVLGGGEKRQPAHVSSLDFAALLLTHGADPNDPQAVYNRATGGGANDDIEWLDLLFDRGLGAGDGGRWYRLLSPSLGDPIQLVGELLQHAAENGLSNRTRLLLGRGADPNGRGMHPAHGGRTAYQGAVVFGNDEVVALLEAAGADTDSVSPSERLAGRLLAESDDRPSSAAAADIEALAIERPDLVKAAVSLGRPRAVRRLVDLGFDVNHRNRMTALHDAASSGDHEMVRLLLDLGADPSIEDTFHGADPAGWADHNGHDELADFIRSRQ